MIHPTLPTSLAGVLCALSVGLTARAADLPSPLSIADVPALARAGRVEVTAAKQRALAAGERPAIVGALEDPMVSPSVDHWPLGQPMADVSLTLEQRFPLSGVLSSRRRAAEADAARLRAEVDTVGLNVEVDALSAYLMLYERRELLRLAEVQLTLARQIVDAAAGRYRSGSGPQVDVIQAEIEFARLEATILAGRSEVAAAEAMFNASIGREPTLAVPPLAFRADDQPPPGAQVAMQEALARRPELRAGEQEIQRAEAEIDAMKSMYAPMAMVRAGPAYTMAGGSGGMLMVGISIPLWRDKLRAGVSEAQAMQRMAAAEQTAMRRMVGGEAATARAQLEAARVRFVALRDDVVPRARQGIDPALSAYASGQLPLVSLLQAFRALWSTQSELVSAEAALGAAATRYGRAIGDPGGTLK